jgi:hypothetical protein
MDFIQYAGIESPLKKITPNTLLKVFHPGIPAMGLAKSPCQRIGLLGNGDEMDMICHEAPGQDFHPEPARLFGQELQIL